MGCHGRYCGTLSFAFKKLYESNPLFPILLIGPLAQCERGRIKGIPTAEGRCHSDDRLPRQNLRRMPYLPKRLMPLGPGNKRIVTQAHHMS